MSKLGLERTFGDTVVNADPQPRYGWQRGSTKPSGKVAELLELDNKKVQPFGPLQESWFLPPPSGIKRDPDQRIYDGQRLVITRGVREPFGPISRLETTGFSFRHGFHCIPAAHLSRHEASLMLGVLWSSLGRYLLFMTAGSWGGWHDQVTSRDVLRTPLRLKPSWGMSRSDHEDAANRIVEAVDGLRQTPVQSEQSHSMFDPLKQSPSRSEQWLEQLNTAIFDLFEVSQAERDLVEDFWAESHELYWKGAEAEATARLQLPEYTKGSGTDLPDAPCRGTLSR